MFADIKTNQPYTKDRSILKRNHPLSIIVSIVIFIYINLETVDGVAIDYNWNENINNKLCCLVLIHLFYLGVRFFFLYSVCALFCLMQNAKIEIKTIKF